MTTRALWLEPRESGATTRSSNLAAHVVGFVGGGRQGRGGESNRSFNRTISGVHGRRARAASTRGRGRNASRASSARRRPAPSVELTIDVRIAVHRRTRAARRASRPAGAHRRIRRSSWIRTPARSSRMASYPDLQPERLRTARRTTQRRNRAVQDTYEPGSTFKIVTAVGGAQRRRHDAASDLIDTNPGFITLPGRGKPISEDQGHNYGVAVARGRGSVKSSNVGAAKIGLQVGAETHGRSTRTRFGFGQRIAPDFAGEARGPGRAASSRAERQRARVDVDGLPDQRDAAADGDGGQRHRQRRPAGRAARRARRHPATAGAWRDAAQARSAASIAPRRRADDDGDSGRRRRAPDGTGKPAALERYQRGRQDRHGAEGRQRRLLRHATTTCRSSASCRRASRCSRFWSSWTRRAGGSRYGGAVAAPIFKRIAEAALQYVACSRPSIRRRPIMVAGRSQRCCRAAAARRAPRRRS